MISIHAPARGATRLMANDVYFTYNFNPRSREGSDHWPRPRRAKATIFQSTLPRGERQYLNLRSREYSKFQSTLPRGERLALDKAT